MDPFIHSVHSHQSHTVYSHDFDPADAQTKVPGPSIFYKSVTWVKECARWRLERWPGG